MGNENQPLNPPLEATPAGLTASQWTAILALRSHEDAPTPTDEGKRPSSVYLSEDRIKAERADLFNKVPVAATVSSYLSEPGMSVALDGYGVPIVVTRDREGVARAFINACRHRSSKLIEGNEPVKGARICCPYHAWTYGLNGDLLAIPRHETFPSLKKENLGLIPLSTHEAGGIIWVSLDRDASPPLQEGSAQICADLEAFGLHKMITWGRRTYDLAANWKLVIEPFLEGYHVQRLHAKSIGNLFADVPNVFTHFARPQARRTSIRNC
jgi:phenylpropionate dioxygenase-like ring-hydroxylating dioxygenase large terminal subunit